MAPQNTENETNTPATIIPTVTRYVEPLSTTSEKRKTDNEQTECRYSYDNKSFVSETEQNKDMDENNKDEKSKENESEDTEPLDFDDILPHIGEFGKYQKLLFLMMIPFAFFVAFVYFTQIFITLVPDEHFCYVPELQHLTKEER